MIRRNRIDKFKNIFLAVLISAVVFGMIMPYLF